MIYLSGLIFFENTFESNVHIRLSGNDNILASGTAYMHLPYSNLLKCVHIQMQLGHTQRDRVTAYICTNEHSCLCVYKRLT